MTQDGSYMTKFDLKTALDEVLPSKGPSTEVKQSKPRSKDINQWPM